MEKTNLIKKMMESKIAAIAKMNVEVAVLAGHGSRESIISIVIDGAEEETTSAAKRIAQMAGERYREGGYDADIEAYFCGINF